MDTEPLLTQIFIVSRKININSLTKNLSCGMTHVKTLISLHVLANWSSFHCPLEAPLDAWQSKNELEWFILLTKYSASFLILASFTILQANIAIIRNINSDQHLHMPCQIRIFTVSMKYPWVQDKSVGKCPERPRIGGFLSYIALILQKNFMQRASSWDTICHISFRKMTLLTRACVVINLLLPPQ